MMAEVTQHDSRYVTHDEFMVFRREVRESLQSISDKLDSRSRPNLSAIAGFLSVGLVIAGMAAALINGSINAQAAMREMADEYQREEQRLIENKRQEIIRRIDGEITSLKTEVLDLDVVMQREMRLLDEILQREMGLHVDRLASLIAVNAKLIERIDEDGSRRLAELSKRNGQQ
jgi:parvulin-like peptidyl-prolyl isomerase